MLLCLVIQLRLTLCTPWTVACQAPLSMRILQARTLEWLVSLLHRIFQTQGWNQGISCIAGEFFTSWATREVLKFHGWGQLKEKCLKKQFRGMIMKTSWETTLRVEWGHLFHNLTPCLMKGAYLPLLSPSPHLWKSRARPRESAWTPSSVWGLPPPRSLFQVLRTPNSSSHTALNHGCPSPCLPFGALLSQWMLWWRQHHLKVLW